MTTHRLNLTRADRLGYVAGGLLLLGWAFRRPSLPRTAAAGLGGWLLYQAYTGENPMFTPLGIRVNPKPSETEGWDTIMLEDSVTVARSREEVFAFWRDLANLPRIAPRLERVEVLDAQRSRWQMRGPGGVPVSWEGEITREDPGQLIAWRATLRGRVGHFGSVELADAPAGRGTVVRVRIEYVPPAGSLGAALGRLAGPSPQSLVSEALHRLKQLLEAGEIATTEGQPSARPAT